MTDLARRGLAFPATHAQAFRLYPIERESSFQTRVLKLARLLGWQLQYHTHDSFRSASGFPDLVLVKPPRCLFAELKADDAPRRLPLEQEAWHDALSRCPGIEAYVWRPRDWRAIEKILSRRSS
jgi:hypothetical protein